MICFLGRVRGTDNVTGTLNSFRDFTDDILSNEITHDRYSIEFRELGTCILINLRMDIG